MRLSKSAALVAALALATTGALAVSQKQAKAATVATVTSTYPARLYRADGTLVKNRALSPNTPWLVGKTMDLKGTKYYQVATSEWMKATDASLSTSQPAQKKVIGTVGSIGTFLVNDQINGIDGSGIYGGTSWVIGKQIVNQYGQHFVQVSSHYYADTDFMTFNGTLPAPIYIANFGAGADTTDNSNNTNTNTNTNTNVDTNTNNNTSNNNQTANDYKPNLANINAYFVKYLNALHAANGTAPVNSSADMISYATQRAGQQDGGNLDHSTATRSTSENLSSAGYDYMINYGGVRSDKDAAYFILKDWYDDNNNMTGAGQIGHYGHRAALIYSGPTVGLGITDSDSAFDADWNYGSLDQFNQLYNYTGSNPNTKFISKDAI